MSDIQQIIFDLGNVLLDFSPRECLSELLGDKGLAGKIYKTLFASPEWIMLDRGVISQEEAEQILIARHPELAGELRLIFGNWFPFLTPIAPNVEILPELKKRGYRLYVLSNFHKAAFEYAREKHQWFGMFDGLLISSYYGVLKPEPAIYRLLLDKFELCAERSLFIDDVVENLEAAKEFGIKTIHYQNSEQLRSEMGVMLG